MPRTNKKKTVLNSSKPFREKKNSERFYQLRVVLMDIEPPIWRRFIVSDLVNLHSLHEILQTIMGWHNSHLHQFVLGANVYADPEMEPDGEMGKMKDEHRFQLGEMLPMEGDAMTYEYDFGDRWRHLVLLEKIIVPVESKTRRLVCLEGERACPPEDCGGFNGYAEVLDIIFNPFHPDYEAMLNWTGKDFNPEVFDLQKVNALLKKLES
jgi:pRiA4b ORF-3-like protein